MIVAEAALIGFACGLLGDRVVGEDNAQRCLVQFRSGRTAGLPYWPEAVSTENERSSSRRRIVVFCRDIRMPVTGSGAIGR